MVARLAEKVPTLQIWKDGQGDMRKYQRIMAKVGDRLAWIGGIGDDCAAGYFAIGVQGYTSSISNVAPNSRSPSEPPASIAISPPSIISSTSTFTPSTPSAIASAAMKSPS